MSIAYHAGQEVMEVYETAFDVELKEDHSPLTLADKRSHEAIINGLRKKHADIPVLSEEGKDISFEERKEWGTFWCVDPLDGTKEFIKRNGEFTVNIALIENGQPVFGVIYAPVLDDMYVGHKEKGAYKIENYSQKAISSFELKDEAIKIPFHNTDVFTIVASRSHMSEETEAFIKDMESKHGQVKTISSGSSLKLCLVAEGKANVYPRLAPTMEWDTAAGQAIVEAAGGTVIIAGSEEPLKYNKENLKNPWFIVK
jgi:3'(2'), 5'-bisphosphate nucleotidase